MASTKERLEEDAGRSCLWRPCQSQSHSSHVIKVRPQWKDTPGLSSEKNSARVYIWSPQNSEIYNIKEAEKGQETEVPQFNSSSST